MPKIDDDEARIFREAMAGVRRLDCDRLPTQQRQRRPPPPPTAVELPIPEPPWSDVIGSPPLSADLPLSFARPGLQNNVLRRLRRGQYSVEGELDLHGLTRREARRALWAFLQQMQCRGARCVRVIHGKGHRSAGEGAVLKQSVDSWLRQAQGVLAFCSARREDGGTGAVYVLLKR